MKLKKPGIITLVLWLLAAVSFMYFGVSYTFIGGDPMKMVFPIGWMLVILGNYVLLDMVE